MTVCTEILNGTETPDAKIGIYVSKSILSSFIIFIYSVIWSLYWSALYIDGDQIAYTQFYYFVQSANFMEGYVSMSGYLGGTEPLFYAFIWLSSSFAEKTLAMSFVNGILAVLIYRALIKFGTRWYIALFVLTTNYYVSVFFFAAERLKFGILMVLIAILVSSRRLGMLSGLLAIGFHFQTLIVLPFIVLYHYKGMLLKVAPEIILITVALMGSFAMYGPILEYASFSLAHKFDVYSSASEGVGEIVKLGAFFVLSIAIPRDLSKKVSCFLFLFLVAFVVGGSRINFLGFFLFVYFSVRERGGLNFPFLLAGVYFFGSNMLFLYKVLMYGYGFPALE